MSDDTTASEIRLEFPLGPAYLKVTQLPGDDPKRRLEIFHEFQLRDMLDRCQHIRHISIVAFAFGLVRAMEKDINEAQESRDPEAIRRARSAETAGFRAVEIIVLSSDVAGQEVPSPQQLKDLAGAAERTAELRRLFEEAWGPRRCVKNVQARVKGKTLTVTFVENDTFDAGAYESLLAQDWLRSASVADYDVFERVFSAIADVSLSLPEELKEIDRLFTAATGGTSFLQFLRAVEILGNHPRDATGVRRSKFSRLVTEVSKEMQCDKSVTRAALRLLTTNVTEARSVIHSNKPWAGISTSFRWRPLLEFSDGSYLYAPASFNRRFQVSYIKAALSGSWPYELTDTAMAPFISYLQSRRDRIRPRYDFEQRVITEIQRSNLGHHWAANIEPAESEQRIGVATNWEIDAIAVDDQRCIIWVVSAKDPAQVLSARQVKNQLKDFYGGSRDRIARSSSTATLHFQVKLLEKNAAAVAAGLGVSDRGQRWETRGIFVTRIPCPAAADRRKTYPIVLLSELGNYLNHPPVSAPEKIPESLARLDSIGKA